MPRYGPLVWFCKPRTSHDDFVLCTQVGEATESGTDVMNKFKNSVAILH